MGMQCVNYYANEIEFEKLIWHIFPIRIPFILAPWIGAEYNWGGNDELKKNFLEGKQKMRYLKMVWKEKTRLEHRTSFVDMRRMKIRAVEIKNRREIFCTSLYFIPSTKFKELTRIDLIFAKSSPNEATFDDCNDRKLSRQEIIRSTRISRYNCLPLWLVPQSLFTSTTMKANQALNLNFSQSNSQNLAHFAMALYLFFARFIPTAENRNRTVFVRALLWSYKLNSRG